MPPPWDPPPPKIGGALFLLLCFAGSVLFLSLSASSSQASTAGHAAARVRKGIGSSHPRSLFASLSPGVNIREVSLILRKGNSA